MSARPVSPSWRHRLRRWPPIVAAALIAAGLLAPIGTASPASGFANPVLSISQTPYITEQANFTVSMQVSSTSGIQFVFFTFCQLSSPVCYSPVIMTLHGTNVYSGTTSRMSSYLGMVEGVNAGYNITIQYSDGFNVTEPALPNSFTNLTVATEVNGAYMYEMTVSPQLFVIGGTVKDSVTGAPIANAAVSISPGSIGPTTTGANGAFSFSGLTNGSYTLAISHAGYTTSDSMVSVSGQNISQTFSITNASSTQSTPSKGSTNLFAPGGTVSWILVAILVVLVAVLAVRLARRGRGGGGAGTTRPSPSPPRNSPGPPV